MNNGNWDSDFNLIVIQLKISNLNILVVFVWTISDFMITRYHNQNQCNLLNLLTNDTKSKQNLHIAAKFCKLHEDTERKRCITQVQIV